MKKAHFVEALRQDVRFGLRVLRRNPGFTLTALLTLALGIGANTAIFSVIYGVLLRPLPYKDGHRLVVLNQQARLNNVNSLGFSVREFQDYRDQNKTMEMVEHHAMSFILYGRGEPERVQTSVVSANFFDVLGVQPILGRTFVPDDEKPGGDAVLVLSNKYWKQSYGGDRNIVGSVFRMNNRPHTVIGVLPPVPEYPSESDVYMPTANCPFRSSTALIETGKRGYCRQCLAGSNPASKRRRRRLMSTVSWPACSTPFRTSILSTSVTLPNSIGSTRCSRRKLGPHF